MHEKLFNPDYLQSLSSKYGLHPSKKYGQNFLIDPEPVEKMVEAAGINKDDTVVEIGPGFGALTFALAEKANRVISFEIEKKLTPYWEGRKPDNVEIEWGNVLKNQISKIKYQKYKVVANLPYQITSAALRFFLENENPPSSMTVMVQKEVAERICARPGDMSILAVSVQYYGQPELVALVPRSSFWPVPAVDSAIIHIVLNGDTPSFSPPSKGGDSHRRRDPNAVIPAQAGIQTIRDPNFDHHFFAVVKAGFSAKRKKLLTNLRGLAKNLGKEKILSAAFSELGLSDNARAQELSLEEWKQLAKVIH
ncbi:MAG: 16S rRNA (adenine(1518)-N(6)/adenine(1519)-N(6))-dimethyltransferase RsmA [bacterium]|nr:16S rRNA (adenine(1518)-N(6)/adenine(1519)-N(6))-dimethyltransferase RsmA [bacterium]